VDPRITLGHDRESHWCAEVSADVVLDDARWNLDGEPGQADAHRIVITASSVPSSVPPSSACRHVASCTTVRPRRWGAGRTTQPGADRGGGPGRRRVDTPDGSTPSMGVSCRSVTQTVYAVAATPSYW
jgi:hypothetical protein